MTDCWEEGRRIAAEVGHGVVYTGPQFFGGQFIYHLFTDAQVTGTTFPAWTLVEAQAALMEKCRLYGKPVPSFPWISDPPGIVDAFRHELDRVLERLA